MILYANPSNRQFVDNRWFLVMALEERIREHSSFSKNIERLIHSEVAPVFLALIRDQAKDKRLVAKHFTIDGTLIEAWPSIETFKHKNPEDGPPPCSGGKNYSVDFKGKKFSNEIHGSHDAPTAARGRQGGKGLLPGASLSGTVRYFRCVLFEALGLK